MRKASCAKSITACCCQADTHHRLQCMYANGYTFDTDAVKSAAMVGSIDCLRYVHTHGCRLIDYQTCRRAAKSGSIECLRYSFLNNCQWDHTTCAAAINSDSPECLRYACDNGCTLDTTAVCTVAASSSSIQCLRLAHTKGFFMHKFDVCTEAAKAGSIECLQYAYEHGGSMDEYICTNAIHAKSLVCLQYACNHGAIISVETTRECNVAAAVGALDCLQYLHLLGCLWDGWTCLLAAYSGHIEILDYLYTNGCPWYGFMCEDIWTNKIDDSYQHIRETLDYIQYIACNRLNSSIDLQVPPSMLCFQYARDHGCPMKNDDSLCIAWNNLQYIHQTEYEYIKRERGVL